MREEREMREKVVGRRERKERENMVYLEKN